MRTLGYITLGLAAVITVAQVIAYLPLLPEKVASHFGADGEADGWMSRNSFVIMHVATQFCTAAFLVGIAKFGRYMPDSLFNLPHKEYWLHESRRETTFNYSESILTLIAGATVLFLCVVFHLVYRANVVEGRLAEGWFIASLVAYLVLIIGLVIRMSMRFGKPPTIDESQDTSLEHSTR